MTTLHIYSNRHIKDQVENINRGDWVFLENGMSRKRWSLCFRVMGIDETALDITYVVSEEFFDLKDMKFDVVIGNPPYQDGSKDGGQNKIYNQFCKKALELSTGIVAFVTPSSVLKKSKRFSLVGQQGLKSVDFTADNHFDVGVNICSWVVDKSYNDDVEVTHVDLSRSIQSGNNPIYDYSVTDQKFTEVYNALKLATNIPEKRMFRHNAVDMTLGRGRVKDKTAGFDYPIHSINSDMTVSLIQYNKPKPKFHGEEKLIIPISKSFTEKNTVVDTRDYDMKHLSAKIENDNDSQNIKSFVFSEYFKSHVDKWKTLDGYGWNYALMYLPIFDKNKHWTNEEVKEFIESFI